MNAQRKVLSDSQPQTITLLSYGEYNLSMNDAYESEYENDPRSHVIVFLSEIFTPVIALGGGAILAFLHVREWIKSIFTRKA